MAADTPNNMAPQPEHSTSTSSDLKRMAQSSLILMESDETELEHFANGALPKSYPHESPETAAARLKISRQSEAQRLKERLSQIPWHAKRAQAEGETYWLRLAGSYQGN